MNSDDFFNPVTQGPPTPAEGEPRPSLEDEFQQVIGQFGRFWGGVRKQGASALDVARKDLQQAVGQARQEISKLTADTSQRLSTETARPGVAPADSSGPEQAIPSPDAPSLPSSPPSQSSIFERIQSSLPPNIARHIPPPPTSLSTLRADLTTQLTHLQSTLSHEVSQAERIAQEYGRKSEALLKEGLKEAGEFIKDAVKVVPPEQQRGGEGLAWDGSDVWFAGFPTPASSSTAVQEASAPQRQPRASSEVRIPKTRAETLLAQLRRTPGILRVDPGSEHQSSAQWESWVSEQWKEDWRTKAEAEDVGDLKVTKEALVPQEMDEETFWKRYFFRIHQIERDEERRKALLNNATEDKEEDFSWDDDEESSAAPATAAESASASVAPVVAVPETVTPRPSSIFEAAAQPESSGAALAPSAAVSSGPTSPRGSSDGSYDVVGEDSATDAAVKIAATQEGKVKVEHKDDSEDSDWE